jgi:hypothetical protein
VQPGVLRADASARIHILKNTSSRRSSRSDARQVLVAHSSQHDGDVALTVITPW